LKAILDFQIFWTVRNPLELMKDKKRFAKKTVYDREKSYAAFLELNNFYGCIFSRACSFLSDEGGFFSFGRSSADMRFEIIGKHLEECLPGISETHSGQGFS